MDLNIQKFIINVIIVSYTYEEERIMAFENGNNIFDYCGKLFEKYQKDRMVFYKALQLLEYFSGRQDYPYCTDDISEVLERVVGYNLSFLSDFLWKYTIPLGKDMEWDINTTITEVKKPDLSKEKVQELVEDFRNDMESFFIATTPFFEELFMGDPSAIRIKKIALKQTYGEEKTVRFIRKDGEIFDFSVNKKDVENIISVFSDIQ